jgi:hypothetical protein
MSLDFAIIPLTNYVISAAYEIKTKLKDNIDLEINIMIDTNYSTLLSSRINKWKKQSYDIITIDQDYNESHSIVVIFADKGSRGKRMDVDEFIELVSSFEDDNGHFTNSDNIIDESDTNQEGGCIIM